MSKLSDLWFGIKIGAKVHSIDEPVEETVIRYKDKFISILETADGEIESLSWARDVTMFHTPIREFWSAAPPVSNVGDDEQ